MVSAKLAAKGEAMLYFCRSASFKGAPLAIAALLACVSSAGAKLAANNFSSNGISLNRLAGNAIAQNGVPANARITTGSALGDLNGVAVEAVIIPGATIR
jgi:hypothetical protein